MKLISKAAASQVNLLRFNAPGGGARLRLYLTPSGALALRPSSGADIVSTTTLTPGVFHEIQLRLLVGTLGQSEVWLTVWDRPAERHAGLRDGVGRRHLDWRASDGADLRRRLRRRGRGHRTDRVVDVPGSGLNGASGTARWRSRECPAPEAGLERNPTSRAVDLTVEEWVALFHQDLRPREPGLATGPRCRGRHLPVVDPFVDDACDHGRQPESEDAGDVRYACPTARDELLILRSSSPRSTGRNFQAADPQSRRSPANVAVTGTMKRVTKSAAPRTIGIQKLTMLQQGRRRDSGGGSGA